MSAAAFLARLSSRRRDEPPPPDPALDELVDLVLEHTVSPVDRWAVAATLESAGVRDVDAVARYACKDVFGLADVLYPRCRARLVADPPQLEPAEPRALPARAARALGLFAKGAFFAVPLTFQLAALLALGYALWASLDFTHQQITMAAVATIFSFIATEGFVHVIGRLGSHYGEQGKDVLLRRIIPRLVAIGAAGALVGAALWAGISVAAHFFPPRAIANALGYYLLLSALWLALAMLYLLRQRFAIAVTSAAGIGVVASLHELSSVSIHIAQWIAIAVAAALAALWAAHVLSSRASRITGDALLARFAPWPLLVRSVVPFFLFGFLYYVFIFLDRLIAWSAGPRPHAYLIWFRAPYELGLDWALLSLLPTIALLEYTIAQFSAFITATQKRIGGLRIRAHNRAFLFFYGRHFLLLAAVALAGSFAVDRIVLAFRHSHVHRIQQFFSSGITFDVHVLAVLGYALLTWGFMNGIFLTSLGRPGLVLRSFAAALVINATVGIVLSHTVAYWYAVVGMDAGALVFAVLTTREVLRLFRSADYSYYAAY